jgi:hypothetical protein
MSMDCNDRNIHRQPVLLGNQGHNIRRFGASCSSFADGGLMPLNSVRRIVVTDDDYGLADIKFMI